jgi:hypothetical protein
MIRFAFAALLASLTAIVAVHTDVPHAAAQDKKNKKNKVAPPPVGEVKDDLSRVLPVFDPGSHVAPISSMGFSKDKSKLITVGQDFTVQAWSTATGERLDILRLPGYGREKGYDPSRWNISAVSPDGTMVAIGGQAKFLFDHEAKANAPARLIMVDVVKRKVARVQLRGNTDSVISLTFSADGEALAVGLGRGDNAMANLLVVDTVGKRFAEANPLLRTADCTLTPIKIGPRSLAFSPDRRSLLVAPESGALQVWDVPAGAGPKPTKTRDIEVDGVTTSLAWAPDGKSFVRSGSGAPKSGFRRIELWNADGTPGKKWSLEKLTPVIKRFAQISTATYLNSDTIYFTANGFVERNAGGGMMSGMIDLKSNTVSPVASEPDGMVVEPVAAVAADGSLVAMTVSGNTQVLVGKPDGSPRIRCGAKSPHPYHIGWAVDPKTPGFAWSDTYYTPHQTVSLEFGFDLSAVKPLGAIQNAAYTRNLLKHGAWDLEVNLFPMKEKVKDDELNGRSALKKDGKFVRIVPVGKGNGFSLVPNGDGPPLVAHGNLVPRDLDRFTLHKSDGTLVARFLPDPTNLNDVAASPDGRFVIAPTGTPRINVYRTDGSPYPLCSFAQVNGEWVIWTPEGYYAASAGGEKMFGWAVNNGPNELVTFQPAVKFAEKYRRPDVIRLAIEKGSVKEALAALDTSAPPIESLLPPSAKLTLVEQNGNQVKVRATATANQPIVSLKVKLDGRPLPEGKGVWTPEPNKPAEAEFVIDVPPGPHELRVLALTADQYAASEPLLAHGPKSPDKTFTIHRVCVGVSEYDDPSLKLNSAANDAREMFAALGRDCVGPQNRYSKSTGELLTDKDATRARVLKAIEDVRRAAAPGDLVVCFFAGHGVVQDNAFYLLTRESDPKSSFKDKALSGDDLRRSLSTLECPVLLLMDACHSAAGLVTFRPASDDLTRALTDESVGVTVMSAAMAHETAGESGKHGHFTAGLLKGLKAGDGVPFDPYDRALYAHHLYSVAFSEVRRISKGTQNPSINLPATSPPLVVREVPAR